MDMGKKARFCMRELRTRSPFLLPGTFKPTPKVRTCNAHGM